MQVTNGPDRSSEVLIGQTEVKKSNLCDESLSPYSIRNCVGVGFTIGFYELRLWY